MKNKGLENGLEFESVVSKVRDVLGEYLRKSKSGDSAVLNQKEPNVIAKELKLEERFRQGFDSPEDIADFTKNYLVNTNHLRHPHYLGHQVAVPKDLSGIPEFINGTVNNPGSLYEM